MSSVNVLALYRRFLRAGKQFQDFNVSDYVLRRASTEFRQNKVSAIEHRLCVRLLGTRKPVQGVTDPGELKVLLDKALSDVEIAERQAKISGMYPPNSENVLQQRKAQQTS